MTKWQISSLLYITKFRMYIMVKMLVLRSLKHRYVGRKRRDDVCPGMVLPLRLLQLDILSI